MKIKKILTLVLALTVCLSATAIQAFADETGATVATEQPAQVEVVTEQTAPAEPQTPANPEIPANPETTATGNDAPATSLPAQNTQPAPAAPAVNNVPAPGNLVGTCLSKTYNINVVSYAEDNNCKYYVTDKATFVLVVGQKVAKENCKIVFRSSVVNSGYTDTEDYAAETYFANNLCDRYGGIMLWYTSLYNPNDYPTPSEYEYEEYAVAVEETIKTLVSIFGIQSYQFETSGYSGGDMAALHIGAQLGAETILITDLHAQGNDEEWPLTGLELANMVDSGTVVVDVRSDGVMATEYINRLEEQMYVNGVDLLMINVHGTVAHGSIHRWIFDYTNIPLLVYGLENIIVVSDRSPYTYFSEMYKPLDSPTT